MAKRALQKAKHTFRFDASAVLRTARKHWKRIAAGAVVFGIGFLIYRGATAQPAGITTDRVVRKAFVASFSANGNVVARRQADLKFSVPSKVAWVGVKKGDHVAAWSAVAGLDQRTLEKDLSKALSQYMTQRWVFEGNLDANEGKILTDAVRRDLDLSQFALNRTVTDVEITDIAKKNLLLVSPISGTVTDIHDLVPGLYLTGSDLERKFVRVVDETSLYFDARVDEVDFGKVSVGQDVRVSLDAYPGEACVGTVASVGREGEETAGGVVTIPVEVTLSDCGVDLVTNLNGTAEFTTDKIENAFVIPKRYLVTDGGKTYVWVKAGDSIKDRQRREVTVGKTNATDAVITKGVSEGETVVYIPAK